MSQLYHRPHYKYYLIAPLIATSVSFFMDALFYRLTWQFHYVDFSRTTPLAGLLVAQHLIYGILLASIFPFGYGGGKALPEGFRFGVLIGTLSFVPIGLSIRSAWYVPLNFGFYLATLQAIFQAIAIGILLAKLRSGSLEGKTV